MDSIDQLRKAPKNIWYRLHLLLYDLRRFKDDPDSLKRLDSVLDLSYIGAPYFTTQEAEQIKATILNDGDKTFAALIEEILNERLERRIKKRIASGDFRVCAAHDLAPLFEKALGVSERQLGRDARFKALRTKFGLELPVGESFEGVGLSKGALSAASNGKKGRKKKNK